MGNSASEIASRVSSLTSQSLSKSQKADLMIIENPYFLLDPSQLICRSDLDDYEVPGFESGKIKEEDVVPTNEEGLILSIGNTTRVQEKHADVVKDLLEDILRKRGNDPSSKEIILRLQSLCRLYEALLRTDHRQQIIAKEEQKKEESQCKLPVTAQAGLRFGLRTLLTLVRMVSFSQPQIYRIVIDEAASILAGLEPLSLSSEDTSVLESIDETARFFGQLLKGELPGVSEDDQLASLTPLFGLALTTGSLSSVLSICGKLLTLPKSEKISEIMRGFFSLVRSLKNIDKQMASLVTWDKTRKSYRLYLSDDFENAMIYTTEWSGVVSEQIFSSGVHFFQLKIEESKDDNLCMGICAPQYSNFNDWYDGNCDSITFKRDTNIYNKSNSLFSFKKYNEGDTVGFLVNMNNKTISFYINEEKMEKDPINFNFESFRLVACMYGYHKVKIVSNSELPEFIKSELVPAEEEVQEADAFVEILDKENPLEEFLKLSPPEVALHILKMVCKTNKPILTALQQSDPSYKVKKRSGLAIDFQNSTMENLNSILMMALDKLRSKDFELLSEDVCFQTINCVQRLLRSHLLVSNTIHSVNIDYKLRHNIMENTIEVLNLAESACEEAKLTLSMCFGVFYKEPSEKLKYLIERLQDIEAGKEQSGIFKQLEDSIFLEMARVDKLFPALELVDEENSDVIKMYFDLLVSIATKESMAAINEEPFSTGIIKLLETSQFVLISQAAKGGFKNVWQEILVNYTTKVLNNCDTLNKAILAKGHNPSEKMIENVQQTICHTLLELLLYGLMLSKMSLDFLANILPALQNLMGSVAVFRTKEPVLEIGSALMDEVYESPHNYPDNANMTQLIKLPKAKKYTLYFDAQCKTESGCDYLELWLDEGRQNKFARWEGDNFPKEPVEVNNELLYFTFRSDGSVNYWGWKIDIRAEVEGTYYKKVWPETAKEAAGMLLALISSKLITGDFESREEDEKIQEILQNPLLMYGVHDKALTIVKQPEPLHASLVDISMSPGVGEKLKRALLTRSYSEDVSKRVVKSQNIAISLSDYVDEYGSWGAPVFSDVPFLQEFISGSERLTSAWTGLKRKAGVVGPATNIGGAEMDQAERAIFAVYISYFEVINTIEVYFESGGDLGNTLKYIVKQTNLIRGWAQKHKQKLMDSENPDITYTDICQDVVRKCCFLLAAEYKLSLNEIGIETVMKNLLGSVTTIQSKKSGSLKPGSKWGSVKKAVKSMSRLKGLSVLKTESHEATPMTEVSEFIKVSELVNKFLESSIPVEKVVEVIENRRTRAIARTLGFLCLSNLINISPKQETPLIRAFGDCFRIKGKKNHYWNGLEGTDPTLLSCVQSSFFGVYGLLQKELVKSKGRRFTLDSYNHYLAVLEAMSCPLKGVDGHQILELQFSATLEILLNWSKGYLGEEVINRPFLANKCITRLGLMEEHDIPEEQAKLVIKEGEPNMCLTIDRGGEALPITEFKVSEGPEEGWEDAVGEIQLEAGTRYILIKRGEAKEGKSYLTNIEEGINPVFEKYENLIAEEPENEKKNRVNLKTRLCKSAWSLFKLLMFSIVGSWHEMNEAKKILTQELFVRVIFKELSWGLSISQAKLPIKNILEFSDGSPWVGKNSVPKLFKKNPMQEWLRLFYAETEGFENFELIDVIKSFVEKADPALKGTLKEIDFIYIDREITETLEEFEENKNSKGEYDFFRYLNVLKGLSSQFSLPVDEYMNSSRLWRDLPEDYYEACKMFDLNDIALMIKKAREMIQGEGTFTKWLDLFDKNVETPGIVKQEDMPEDTPLEFKNTNSELDFYICMHAIMTEEKFEEYRKELSVFLSIYNDLPTSCADVVSSNEEKCQYFSSLLWALQGSMSSRCLSMLLAREEYLKVLLQLAFRTQSEKLSLMAMRLAVGIVPNQHSLQSLETIWEQAIDPKTNILTTLFTCVGRGTFWYAQPDKRKASARREYEAINFLNALNTVDRWRSGIIKCVIDNLSSAIEKINSGEPLSTLQVGITKYLAVISNDFEDMAYVPIEFSRIKLKNCSLARGVICKLEDSNMSIYSVIEDSRVTENIDKIDKVEPLVDSSFYKEIRPEDNHTVSDCLTKLWLALQSSKRQELKAKPESIASYRILHQSVEMFLLTSLTSLLKTQETVEEKDVSDLMETILKNSKDLGSAIASSYQKIANGIETARIEQKLVEEPQEEQKEDEGQLMNRISQMNEQDQILATELISLSVPPATIIKCFDQGIKEVEAILNYKHEEASQSNDQKNKNIYKLANSDNLKIKDLSDRAEIYQDNMSHIVISSSSGDEMKQATFKLPETIFHDTKGTIGTVTITAVLMADPQEGQINCGFVLGRSQIGFTTVTGTPSIVVDGEIISEWDITSNFAIRVHAHANGMADIIIGKGKKQMDMSLPLSSVFNGTNIGKVGVYMESGRRLDLLTLDVYEGVFTGAFQGKLERAKPMEGGERYVRIKPKSENPNKLRLRLLGLDEELITKVCSTNSRLGDALSSAVGGGFDSEIHTPKIDLNQTVITDIKLFEKAEDIPADFQTVKTYEDDVFTDFHVENRKLIALKKDVISGSRACIGFCAVENAKNFDELGDLTIGEGDRSNMLYVKFDTATDRTPGLKDIIYIKAQSIYSVRTPYGYELVTDKEGKAINLASKTEKSYYLFLAVKAQDSLLSCSINLFSSTKAKSSTYGMIDNTSANKEEKDSNKYEGLSLIEFYAHLLSAELKRTQKTGKTLFTFLFKKFPSLFENLAMNQDMSKLFSFVKSDLSIIKEPIESLLADGSKQDFHRKLVLEIVRSLLEASISIGGAALRSFTVESSHPYECNLDIDQTLTIPGARGLRIEFDPQTHTESGCDPLRFYERPNRDGELRCYSGEGVSNWQPLDITGDTVYSYFHTDGSVVYWGYKFEVIPVGGSGSKSVDVEPYVWMLEKISKLPQLDSWLGNLTSPNFIQTLFMYTLSARDTDEKSRLLTIFTDLLRGQSHPLLNDIFELLWNETDLIANETRKTKLPNPILQTLMLMYLKVKNLYTFKIDKEWFIEFNELVFDMKALAEKDESIELLLFESFKEKAKGGLEEVIESDHPYKRETQLYKLHNKGAAFLNIEMDEESACELSDTVFIAYDEEGKNPVSSKKQVVKEATWSNNFMGPDIAYSNNNLTVTRTNSSSWGNAVMTEIFSEGKVKVNFVIENDGDSSYLYIGVYKTQGSYELSSVINSDCSNEVWSWKRTGEFHRKGNHVDGAGFSTGDKVSFQMDFDARTLVFFKNGNEVHTFDDVAESLQPVVCFGGSNQFVTIQSVETIGVGAASLEKFKMRLIGDTGFMWFPVNNGFEDLHKWKSLQESAEKVSDYIIKKENDSTTVHNTDINLRYGKHYAEFTVENTEEGKIGIGFCTEKFVQSNDAGEAIAVYYSDGKIGEDDIGAFGKDDKIGIYFDSTGMVLKFYKNGAQVAEKPVELNEDEDEEVRVHFVCVLNSPGQVVKITEKPDLPEGIDIFTVTAQTTEKRGFKAKLSPVFKGRDTSIIESILNRNTPEVQANWRDEYMPKYKSLFVNGAVEQLVIYLDELVASKGYDVLAIGTENIDPKPNELIYYPELEKVDINDMRELYRILLNFNQRIKDSLHLFDMHIDSIDSITELQRIFIDSRSYIFFSLKNNLLKELLEKTKSDNRMEMTIDRPKAMRHKARKDVDINGQFSIFGQIYRALLNASARDFRNPERIFKVNYRGEGSVDAGGPYNEVMSNMCDELQSAFLRLIVPIQNNIHNMGENRDAWIVNPAASTPSDMELFLFLGKLMGVAIRTQNNLNLSLPPLFWKRIMLEKVDVRDLRAVDVCLVEILAILRNLEGNGITKETFALSYDEKFTTKDTSGNDVELIEGGKNVSVTFENAREYAELVEKCRLNENPEAYAQIRTGISMSVPLDYLNLFSWRQVQTLVCGAPDIDIDILKGNTDYEGCGENDQHIVFFWEVLREFTPKERSLFLKFVWGRSKLPSGKDWKHMKITRYNPPGQVNNYMPITHTCFFTIDLPAYTTKEAMRKKMLYAITHCTAIDLDGAAGQGWEEEDNN